MFDEILISTEKSSVKVYLIKTNEELVIAKVGSRVLDSINVLKNKRE